MANKFEAFFIRSWLRRGTLARALWPLSRLFGALAARRAETSEATRLPVPVLVVGNIFVGGTGKTPFTIWLVEQLRAAGRRPGIISRGHGASADNVREVLPESRATEVGDEPVLMRRRTGVPVFVGRQRVEAGRALLEAHPEVDCIVSDDGLQHYALARDLEILLFDGRGAGNGWLLPAGPLREPVTRRRDLTIINGDALPEDIGADPANTFHMTLTGDIAYQLAIPEHQTSLIHLRGKRLAAAAGIGNPARFFDMLRAAGLTMQEIPLPDHFDFARNPFATVDADLILITEKDAVKCGQLNTIRNDPRVWVVPVTARLAPALATRILEICRGRTSA